jgi:putative membrane protein
MDWQLHPDVIFWMAVLEGGYLLLARRGLRRHPGEYVLRRRQVVTYSLGVFVLWVAAGTPIHDYGERYLFSVHMIEHLLITMVGAPLLLLGTPDWMLRPLLTQRHLLPLLRILTLPIVTIVIFNATTLFTHLPPFMNFVLEHHPYHFLAHVLLFATALLMWWPVFSPLPELPRLHFSGQFIYLFVQSLVPSIIASFMTFGSTVLYSFYEHAPRRWGLSPIGDQVLAGLIMKLSGGAIIFGLMAVVFFRWYNQEQREHPDALEELDARGGLPADLTWEEIESELQRMGLTHSQR